ncbi:KdsC family phosphatase [Candidatus Neomarinimicrobiota bacterium]
MAKLDPALVKGVKLIICDVDGILTDGSLYIGADHTEFKKFTVMDGSAMALARAAEIPVALISARTSDATTSRAEQLGIEDVYQGNLNKLEPYADLLRKYDVTDAEVAYLGDGYVDIPVMERVGVPISVPEADPLVKDIAVYITERRGGQGVLLDAVKWILIEQGRFEDVLTKLRKRINTVK